MATIVISEELVGDKFLQACRIIQKMRQYRIRWEKNHDANVLKQVKFWEAKADEFMNSLVIEEDNKYETPSRLKDPDEENDQ